MADNKKTLDQWQLDDAARLRHLINAHLEKNKVSQLAFMGSFGLSQGMMHQLCGSAKKPPSRPLNYDHVAMFAEKLGVPIERISPTLAKRLLEICRHIKDDSAPTAINQ